MHYTWGVGYIGDGFIFDITQHGFAGVMIFFVLSGFILTHVYEKTFSQQVASKDYSKFIFMRFARIYPLHLFTLLAFGFFGLVGYRIRSISPTCCSTPSS